MITKFKLFENSTSITIDELKNNKYVIFGIDNAKIILNYIIKNVDNRYKKYIMHLRNGVNKYKMMYKHLSDPWDKEILMFSFGENEKGPYSTLYLVNGYHTTDPNEIDDIETPEERYIEDIDNDDKFKGELKLKDNELLVDNIEIEKKEIRLNTKKYNL
jgi:hypothetical protein